MSMTTLPPEYDPQAVEKAGTHLRGQIFGIGLSISWAMVFFVLGGSLFFGVELITAIIATMVTFGILVVISFFAELIIEPSLEQIAKDREAARIAHEREEMPGAGGIMAGRLALIGGADETHPNVVNARPGGQLGGRGGVDGQKGRRLDVTLPEEHTAPPPRAASGTVGGPRAQPSPQPQKTEEFQDLASLLKEAAQPSPVTVRQRQ